MSSVCSVVYYVYNLYIICSFFSNIFGGNPKISESVSHFGKVFYSAITTALSSNKLCSE